MGKAAPKKIVVVGAHPDDPEMACGGMMALLAQVGHDVVAAYLTRGEAGIPGRTQMEAFRGLECGSDYAEAFVRHAQSADITLSLYL